MSLVKYTKPIRYAARSKEQIALIGDSVLDNFFWIQNPRLDVRQQLAFLVPDKEVINHAVSGSKVIDVLNGIIPKKELQESRAFFQMQPYKTDESGTVKSLQESTSADYVVLGVGGNEGEQHLSKFIWGASHFVDAVVKDGIVQQFAALMERLSAMRTKNILILTPKPHDRMFKEFRQRIGFGLQFIPLESLFQFSSKLDQVYGEKEKNTDFPSN